MYRQWVLTALLAWPALAAAFTVVAAAFHLLAQSQRPLWTDEASTYWTIHTNVFDLLRDAHQGA